MTTEPLRRAGRKVKALLLEALFHASAGLTVILRSAETDDRSVWVGRQKSMNNVGA